MSIDLISLCNGRSTDSRRLGQTHGHQLRPLLEYRVHLPHPESLSSGAPPGLGSATEPPLHSGGMSGSCLDPCCRSCTDCPSCVGGTARIPTDFRVVHHTDGTL